MLSCDSSTLFYTYLVPYTFFIWFFSYCAFGSLRVLISYRLISFLLISGFPPSPLFFVKLLLSWCVYTILGYSAFIIVVFLLVVMWVAFITTSVNMYFTTTNRHTGFLFSGFGFNNFYFTYSLPYLCFVFCGLLCLYPYIIFVL